MPADLLTEPAHGLAHYARRLGKDPSTLYRWATRGLTIDGRTYRLAVVYVGSQLRTTDAAVREFLDTTTRARLEALAVEEDDVVGPRDAATEADLADAGLLDD